MRLCGLCVPWGSLFLPPPPPPTFRPQPEPWGLPGQGKGGWVARSSSSPFGEAQFLVFLHFPPRISSTPCGLSVLWVVCPQTPPAPPAPSARVRGAARICVPVPPCKSGSSCRVGFKSVFTQLGDSETRPRKAIKRSFKSSCPSSAASPSAGRVKGGGICPPCAAPPHLPILPPPNPAADTREVSP